MRTRLRKVPSFELYGDSRPGGPGQRLHIEDIQSRSHRYRWEIAAHTHRGLLQCVYVTQGPAEAQVGGQAIDMKPPAVVLLPAGSVHAFRFSPDTRGWVLTVAPETLHEPDVGDIFATPQHLALERDGELPRRLRLLFERLAEEFRQPDSLATPLCRWLACSALWLVAHEAGRHRQTPAGTPRQHRWLAQFRALLESHYAEHWPVQRYARALGLTEGRLNRLVRAHNGRSAFELMQQRLVVEAQRRLTYVAMPVTQVAHELGFGDPAYFCRFFRRHTGSTPRAFRARHGAIAPDAQ